MLTLLSPPACDGRNRDLPGYEYDAWLRRKILDMNKPVDAAAFRQIVGRRGTDLVFLNACESGRGGRPVFP